MSNKNGRALAEKEAKGNALEQMFPGSTPVKPTEKEQRKLDELAARWMVATNALEQAQLALTAAQEEVRARKDQLLGLMEFVADEYGADFKRINWAYDGTHLLLAEPK